MSNAIGGPVMRIFELKVYSVREGQEHLVTTMVAAQYRALESANV